MIPRLWPVGALFICLLAACTSKNSQIGERVVLNVDGKELRAAEFADQLAARLKNYDALGAKDPALVMRAKNEIARDFIIQVLTENWAKENSVFVRKEDLEAEVAVVRKGYPDDLTFETTLAEQNLTFANWREKLAANLLQKLVIKRLNEKSTQPSDEEIRSYYQANKEAFERPERVSLRQIVLATEADAHSIEAELKKGKKISELAPKFSITPDGKRGGELGWIEKGSSEVFDQAFTMAVGRRSEIVKSPYGYHIFEVLARKPAQTAPLEEVKSKIRYILLANREQALYSSWLEKQVRKARILRDDELISQIKVQTKER